MDTPFLLQIVKQEQLLVKKIQIEIQSFFSPYCLCYLVKGSQKYSFSAILNFDNNAGEFFEVLNQIRALAEQQFQCPVTLACGGICDDLKDLPQLYTNAIYTLDYIYIKGMNCVILSEEVLSQDEFNTSYPYVELQNLKKQLKRRNIQTINQQMKKHSEFSFHLCLLSRIWFSSRHLSNYFFYHSFYLPCFIIKPTS